MIGSLVLSFTGAAFLCIRPIALHIRRRRYDRDVAAGISAALHQSYAPPATDRELLDLLKKVP